MNRNVFVSVGGTAALGLVLAALPSHSAMQQVPAAPSQAPVWQDDSSGPMVRNFEFSFGDGSWLGVEPSEVTGDKAKELKLPAEHGVLLDKVMNDSPASKAGLKENDVVTEINGQRVEGAAQFRRMLREIPAGRTAQLTVWRDGRTQSVTVTMGKLEESRRNMAFAAPGAFALQVPEMPDLPVAPEWTTDGGVFAISPRPRLGIDAEDLNGQLGTFFGAPEGEGILVRDVANGSVAEKAGLKAGDVIVSLNGNRVRSVGDLRAKLGTRAGDKATTAKLGVLRNHSEISLSVELPAPVPRAKRVGVHNTNI
ncbi:MAG TPA: PDZ domain-containing protein [Candidatus Dormibacteraeota bacterium]|nr:PDZ domain-containing protein [Candidatus Dormibacteraeota bacterium]